MRVLSDALLDRGYEYLQNFERQFESAVLTVERDLETWYARLADNNEISLLEAKRLLSSSELREFRWTVEEYIKFGKENALDGRWMKELENASARVHISRLDSIKLQLQQQAERLYGNQLDGVDALVRQIYTDGYYHTAFELQKGFGVGWSLQDLNDGLIEKVLSRPWTTDGKTFRDRCWANKQALVDTVNTQLTQMIMRGDSPDKAIAAISKQFGVSKNKAGRLVMTESAAFSSVAQKDCYEALEVERYRLVETLDTETCETCGELDGRVFKMSDYQVGVTAPPFHPWCRGCTCPHFDDMEGMRAARDADGKSYSVPGDMTYSEWREKNTLHTLNINGEIPKKRMKEALAEINRIPPTHRALAESQISSIYFERNISGGRYNADTRVITMSTNYMDGELIHEYAHGLERALKIYQDKDFLQIRAEGLQNLKVEDIIEDTTTFTRPIYRIEHPKLVSEYQGRLYEKYGIYDGANISLEGMLEYFSEGYREYILNPERLREFDPELYRYLEVLRK